MKATTVQELRQPHPEQGSIDARAAQLLRSSSRWTNGPGERPESGQPTKKQRPAEPNQRS